MYDPDKFGAQLQSSHPFSLVKPLQDDIDLFSGVVQGKTADKTGAVQLIQGNVECTSCHNPHIQAVDKLSMNFLVKDSSSAQLCLSCHDPARTSVSGNIQVNPLAGWAVGIHAIATNKVSAQAKLGSYGTVGADGCISCHLPHNAQGPARLLRGQNEQACIGCHSGGSNLSPAAPNVFAEFGKVGHPFPNGTNQHDAAESAVLNNNRHATCADCHNSHGAEQVTIFNAPPLLRVSQANTSGVKIDGTSVINPAINEYEPCLRCHGYSAGKVSNPIYGYMPGRASADPLNLITQMNLSAKSSHPVMHIRNSTSVSQPSLLLTMLDFDGTTTKGRSMGQQIFCSDCHNSDDNREFGGSGANGPHGSKWLHILERDYEFSQAPGGPGTPITININKQPNLTVNGPYGMCAKCHDLNVVIGATSWANHGNHVRDDGFSCSVCHSPHGMTAGAGNPTGVRMVDFDTKVVGSNSGQNISYNQGANTCVLVCHSVAHDAQGHVKAVSTNGPAKK
jgi:predicted CXXCH cytochrome family protein